MLSVIITEVDAHISNFKQQAYAINKLAKKVEVWLSIEDVYHLALNRIL